MPVRPPSPRRTSPTKKVAASGDIRGPAVVISRRGAERLKNGHVWVYRSDVVSADGVAPGAVVPVNDERGRSFGSALYSSSSQIAVRMISSGPVGDFPQVLRTRVREAVAYRESLVRDTDAYRVIFSEGDFLSLIHI